MCGIAGQISADPNKIAANYPAYCRMQKSLARRGPDQRGMYLHGHAALIHARLAVVDLENGCQPMVLDQGGEKYILVYNGELYNTPELHAQLAALGHRFVSHSDTEVLLHAFAQWGPDCLEKLNGIFAFAVWQQRAQKLFLARDRIGVKPLFYALRGDSLIFASELKPLLCHPEIPPQVDAHGLADVLLLGPGRTPGCGVFRNVQELKPGCCAEYTVPQVGAPRLTVRRYWQLTDHDHPDDFAATARRVRDLVTDAIERQLVSDVPVATFLSGGLDSSLISAIADAHFTAQGNQLQTFSVGYRDNKKYFHATKFQPGADAPYIRKMNDFLHARHHWVTLDTPELVPALYAAVDARDLPGMADVDASLLVFCRHIKPHATVALSGECADEIFGGYPWYRDPTVRERYGFPWAQSTAYRASFIKPGVLGGIDPAAFVDERYLATLAQTSVRPGLPAAEQRMRQMMNLNFKWFMQTLLDRKDRMSMYSGLEVRVPFCDHRIVEYAYNMPWDFKSLEGREKGIVRRAFANELPKEIVYRKKSPYPKTFHPVYTRLCADYVRRIFEDNTSVAASLFDRNAVQKLMQRPESLAEPWFGQLMRTPQIFAYIIQLDRWFRHYHVKIV